MVVSRVLLGLLTLLVALLPAGEASAVNIDVTGDFTTTLEVAADGNYQFSLLGDEGSSRLLINGTVVVDGSATSGWTWLAQGVHSLTVEFDDCCGGIQLALPENVAMQPIPIPEPHTLVLLGAGLAVLAVAARMRTRSSTSTVGARNRS